MLTLRVGSGTSAQQDTPFEDESEVGFCLQVRTHEERLAQESACEYKVVEFFVSH